MTTTTDGWTGQKQSDNILFSSLLIGLSVDFLLGWQVHVRVVCVRVCACMCACVYVCVIIKMFIKKITNLVCKHPPSHITKRYM